MLDINKITEKIQNQKIYNYIEQYKNTFIYCYLNFFISNHKNWKIYKSNWNYYFEDCLYLGETSNNSLYLIPINYDNKTLISDNIYIIKNYRFKKKHIYFKTYEIKTLNTHGIMSNKIVKFTFDKYLFNRNQLDQ